MKKYFRSILATFILMCSLSLVVNAGTMYNRDGSSKYIYSWEVENYKASGDWSNDKPVTMYAPDGRTYNVFPSEIEAYKAVGWYSEPVIYVYALDKRSIVIPTARLADYKAVGWYESHEVYVTMYAPDGRTTSVFITDVDAYKSVGWYTEPFVEVYAADGRTMYVIQSQLEAYKAVGWYDAIYLSKPDGSKVKVNPFDTATIQKHKNQGWYEDFAVFTTDGRTATVPVYELNSYLASGWLRGVTMYSDDGRTISVSPYQIDEYKKVGWHPAFDIKKIDGEKVYLTVYEPDIIVNGLSIRYYDANGKVINGNMYNYGLVCYFSWSDSGYYMTEFPSNAVSFYLSTSNIHQNFDTIAYDNVYYYCKYITMYSDDGRSIQVPELQAPQYEAVGWKKPVTMYAADGRQIQIPHFQINDYKAVGWYDVSGYIYHFAIVPLFNDYYNAKDYDSAMATIDEVASYFAGTEYESPLQALKNKAMDAWRKNVNGPLACTGYTVSENSIGTPKVTLYFTNVSYKKIVAFKVKFNCYDVFGSYESSYYDYYYTDSADLDSAESASYTWVLYGADSVNTVKNIRVTEVVYSDGTKWK